MKNLICLFFAVVFVASTHAQTSAETYFPYDLIFPNSIAPKNNSIQYSSGIKSMIGVGIVKPITSRFYLTSNLGFSIWTSKAVVVDFNGNQLDEYRTTGKLFNLSFGERFHIFRFKKSSFYSALQFNLQYRLNKFNPNNIGLSMEPSIGWRKKLGEKSEVTFSIGYDQPITSNKYTNGNQSGNTAFSVGYNFRLSNTKNLTQK